ncbi:MAG: DUF5916 domain-containing protein [Crocinitomicaceae bacterium]
MSFARAQLLICALFLGHSVLAQKSYFIKFNDNPIKIDGELKEPHWKEADIVSNFIVNSPVYGGASEFISEIRLYYDSEAIYVGGILKDPSPDSVSYSLSQRDQVGNADWVRISIDPYGNNVNAFTFAVTAAGVEIDGLESIKSTDYLWNAVWKSATVKHIEGWSFEMRIPFSAIRFPNKEVQDWNLNFWRQVRRVREVSTWNAVDPNVFGEITQSGKLEGVKGIKSPIRLSFTPYATSYLVNSYDNSKAKQTWKSRLAGGMDLKYGLNDAFTLDMTLIPDFGQTASDNEVLNLGPFEVYYNENRPFFLEGTDLFNIGGVFYTRRIGGQPYNYESVYSDLDKGKGERVIRNAQQAPLINGTKVSGRTNKGLGIGIFNALEGRVEAIIEDSNGVHRNIETNPLTNYNVFVLSQNLKNNSTVSLVNTNVMRSGRAHDANVTAGTVDLYTFDGKYRISSNLKVSSIFRDKPEYGHALSSGIRKVAGTWRYGFSYGEESDKFNPNDLGFLYNNNSRFYDVDISWNDFKPTKHFYRRSAFLSFQYEELYKPQLFSYLNVNTYLAGLHKKQLYTRITANINPFGSVDHFESRQFGKEVKFNPNVMLKWFFTSDYSKRFALDGDFWFKKFFGRKQYGTGIYISPRFRVSDRMFLVWETRLEFIKKDYGFVASKEESYEDVILIGFRDRDVVVNKLSTEFSFTKRMGFDLQFRHYWQQVDYINFATLQDDASMVVNEYNPLEDSGESAHNTSYNAFTLDLNYRWVFMPGSELRIVYKNNIFHSKTDLDASYFRTFDSLFDEPQVNSISMKLLFYIDAIYFRSNKKKQ